MVEKISKCVQRIEMNIFLLWNFELIKTAKFAKSIKDYRFTFV